MDASELVRASLSGFCRSLQRLNFQKPVEEKTYFPLWVLQAVGVPVLACCENQHNVNEKNRKKCYAIKFQYVASVGSG